MTNQISPKSAKQFTITKTNVYISNSYKPIERFFLLFYFIIFFFFFNLITSTSECASYSCANLRFFLELADCLFEGCITACTHC